MKARRYGALVVPVLLVLAGWERAAAQGTGWPADPLQVPPRGADGDAVDPGDCDWCFRPQWSVRAGAILLQRSTPNPLVLVNDQFAAGGNTIVDAADFRFSVEGGPEVSVLRRGRLLDWEVRYFGITEWGRSLGPIYSSNGAVMRFAAPLGNVGFPAQVSASYESELQNFEINVGRSPSERFRWLAGFRYVELDERGMALVMDIGPGLNRAVTTVDALNRLYGFQIGAEGVLLGGGGNRLRLEGTAKAGVYHNSIHSGATLDQSLGVDYAAAASDNHAAFVGELGFTAVYQLSPHWSLRAGYQMLWLEGVAVAAEQVPAIDLLAGQAAVDTTGSPFYHGANVGLEFVW